MKLKKCGNCEKLTTLLSCIILPVFAARQPANFFLFAVVVIFTAAVIVTNAFILVTCRRLCP